MVCALRLRGVGNATVVGTTTTAAFPHRGLSDQQPTATTPSPFVLGDYRASYERLGLSNTGGFRVTEE